MNDFEPREPLRRRLLIYLPIAFITSLPAMVIAVIVLSNPHGIFANAQKAQPPNAGSAPSTCPSTLARGLSLRCVSFSGHLYAVADIDLQLQKIVFTTSGEGKQEAFPEVVRNLSSIGIDPLLVTNAGIYGRDNRPLGLLISPKGKLHDANTKTANGAVHGNFSWDSAVFQIADDGIASIAPVRAWRDSRRIVAATQSGPQLASAGTINQGFQAHSFWSYRRTAIGVDQSNRRLVHLVVSRDSLTLFELATFMVNELHCSEALHLDGDLSAFYLPSATEKFLFSDPGERIVTVLSVVALESKKASPSAAD